MKDKQLERAIEIAQVTSRIFQPEREFVQKNLQIVQKSDGINAVSNGIRGAKAFKGCERFG